MIQLAEFLIVEVLGGDPAAIAIVGLSLGIGLGMLVAAVGLVRIAIRMRGAE